MATANTPFGGLDCYDCSDRLEVRGGEKCHTSYTACPGFYPYNGEYVDGAENPVYWVDMNAWHKAAKEFASDKGEQPEFNAYDPCDYGCSCSDHAYMSEEADDYWDESQVVKF